MSEIKELEKEKEVALVKRQISKAISFAQALKIKNKEDLVKAVSLLSKIKRVGKLIKERKEKITNPANDILRNARDFFRPLEQQYEEAERIVKKKMVIFNDQELAKAKKKEEKIVEKVEEGKMSMEKGSEKIEKITPEKTVRNGEGQIQFKTIRDVVIRDQSKLPRSYLMPNTSLIRRDALDGKEIPGVEVVKKKIVAGTSY